MKEILKSKSVGFIFVAAAAVSAIVSLVWFLTWASARQAMDGLLVGALLVGLVCDIILVGKDCDYLMILSTACYSFGLFKLLTNSVGSFVDAFQGINMFGDATQVNTIISISIAMAVSAVLSIVASFLKRVKE